MMRFFPTRVLILRWIETNAGRLTARGLHYAKPAMQVMSTNPLRATEATVRASKCKQWRLFKLNFAFNVGLHCQQIPHHRSRIRCCRCWCWWCWSPCCLWSCWSWLEHCLYYQIVPYSFPHCCRSSKILNKLRRLHNWNLTYAAGWY